jgi:hypothetical protein
MTTRRLLKMKQRRNAYDTNNAKQQRWSDHRKKKLFLQRHNVKKCSNSVPDDGNPK